MRGVNEKRNWMKASLWNTLVLLYSLLVMQRGMKLLRWVSSWLWMPLGPALLVHRVKQDCTYELQMSCLLSFSFKPILPCFYFWIVWICNFACLLLLISPPMSSPVLIIFAFFSCRLDASASHMLLAESQLSLLSQSDGPGHTSGNPWQGSPLPSLLHHRHPLYRADWIKIFR